MRWRELAYRCRGSDGIVVRACTRGGLHRLPVSTRWRMPPGHREAGRIVRHADSISLTKAGDFSWDGIWQRAFARSERVGRWLWGGTKSTYSKSAVYGQSVEIRVNING